MTLPAKTPTGGELAESVYIQGDLSKLSPGERAAHYKNVCESMGLNPLTKPFEYITLNGKLQLYALRAATDQLRKINGVSLEIVSQDHEEGIFSVHVRATLPDGRKDEDLGTVPLPDTLKGEARANAVLKAITKAKRRATLSICGLGWLDEAEVETIPAAARRPVAAPNVMVNRTESPLLTSGEYEPADGGAAAVNPEPPDPPAAAPTDLEAEIIDRTDKFLADCAEKGMDALSQAWNGLDNETRKTLKSALDRRHKVRAQEVDLLSRS